MDDEFGDVSIPIVNRGACIYANDRPRHINVQRAYGLVNEWLEEVVKPLAGHWNQVRRTWRIQIAPDILLEDECYGVTQVTTNTIDITLDTKPHKGYSELLSTLLHEVGHALTVQEAPEHGLSWFHATLSLIVATRMRGVLTHMARVGLTQMDLNKIPCSIE